jgi:hypothetical protein
MINEKFKTEQHFKKFKKINNPPKDHSVGSSGIGLLQNPPSSKRIQKDYKLANQDINSINKSSQLANSNNKLINNNISNIFDKLNKLNQNENQINLKRIMEKNYHEDMTPQDALKEHHRHLSKRNKIDESDSEDSANEQKSKSRFVIDPENGFKRLFDLILAL